MTAARWPQHGADSPIAVLQAAAIHGLQRYDAAAIGVHFRANNPIPAGFVGNADDLAPMAAFLCSPLARFIVGQNIVIDGGQHASLF